MDTPTSPVSAQAPQKSFHNVRQLAFAALLIVPALAFWALLSMAALLVYNVVALLQTEESDCSVARIPLHGVLTTTAGGYATLLDFGWVTEADSIAGMVEEAEGDESIRAIIIDVDSPGGTPVAGDEMAGIFAATTKPTVAVVRDVGASAAYWVMAGSDRIIASPISHVGSIGVTMSYTETAGAQEEEGSRWVGIASGEHKDAGNPERTLSEEEREFFQGEVDAVHEYMIDRIATLRPVLSRAQYGALADGRAYIGSKALTLGLVDEVGGFNNALRWIESKLGLSLGEAKLCKSAGRVWGLW